MMSNTEDVKKRPLDDLAMNSEPNGDASLPHDMPAHVPEETSLKRLKAEDDDHVPMSSATAPSIVSSSEQHPLVPSLDHARSDFSVLPGHSTSDQTVDSDMSVPNSLSNAPATNVLSGPQAPAPAPEAAALTLEPRNPDSIDVSKVSSVCFCEFSSMGLYRPVLLWVNKADSCVRCLLCHVFRDQRSTCCINSSRTLEVYGNSLGCGQRQGGQGRLEQKKKGRRRGEGDKDGFKLEL
ncbi:MAG: hypothetical protein J3Q66DRAFT_323142 [Benniella sp.]|nr:MAG: hypothetical protein J3Q66DRAFT_323142 [Benniella sp.]